MISRTVEEVGCQDLAAGMEASNAAFPTISIEAQIPSSWIPAAFPMERPNQVPQNAEFGIMVAVPGRISLALASAHPRLIPVMPPRDIATHGAVFESLV